MNRIQALSLYRRILRLHQVKLPAEMRAVGDRYVRQEFRAHREVPDFEFTQFMAQWQEYQHHLELEADIFGIGRDLADTDISNLSDDQKHQLSKLRDSAMRVSSGNKDTSATD